MHIAHALRATTAGLSLAMFVATSQAGSRMKAQKAHVRFLATGTLIRGTWGPNEDTYLVEVAEGTSQLVTYRLVTLIDEYANKAPPLSTEVLTSPTGLNLRLRRDSQCDRPYSQLVFRAAPGDLIALIRGKLAYAPKLNKVPQPGEVVPCYRVVR